MRRFAPAFLAFALTAPAAGSEPFRLLANDGAIVEARAFELGTQQEPQPAIRVTISRQGSAPTTFAVPGTEGPQVERLITADLATGGLRANLVWITADGGRSRRITSQMVDLQFGTWLEARDVLAFDLAPGAPEPTWLVTRDQYAISAEDGSETARHAREVAHVFWWADGDGRPTLRYTPVLLVDGAVVGTVPVFALDALDQANTFAPPAPDRLFRSLDVVRNGEEPRIGLVFLSPRSGRLLGLELQVIPGELSLLADRARGHIIDLGAALYPSQMATLADRARGHIIDLASGLHPASALFAADGVRLFVEGYDTVNGLHALADRARGHIIDLVSTPVRGGVSTEVPATRVDTYELPEMAGDGNVKLTHLVRARALSSWSLPAGSGILEASFTPIVSPRGDAAILAWISGDGTLTIVETQGTDTLGPVRHLPMASMSFESAVATLRARLDGR